MMPQNEKYLMLAPMILTPKREITKLLWYVFHLKDKARQHVIYTRSLTCELARAVPHVTIVGP